LLPAYSALVQKFSPNSDIHRSTLLAGFWTRNILNHEDIDSDRYAAELVRISNEVNSKMATEHIKTIDLISNLKRGLTPIAVTTTRRPFRTLTSTAAISSLN
jgi:hypothetical protein